MNPKKHIGNFILALILIYLCLSTGCAQSRKAVPVIAQSACTCEEVETSGIRGFSDHEVAELLDQALADERNDCWMPVMEQCLNQSRDISQRHLAKAVHVFNKRHQEDLFHKAVLRYFTNLAKGQNSYGPQDRLLLETYCSYLINNATTRHDSNLQQASLLCHRLDQDLYGRLFQ